jgi:hypothetical protein
MNIKTLERIVKQLLCLKKTQMRTNVVRPGEGRIGTQFAKYLLDPIGI